MSELQSLLAQAARRQEPNALRVAQDIADLSLRQLRDHFNQWFDTALDHHVFDLVTRLVHAAYPHGRIVTPLSDEPHIQPHMVISSDPMDLHRTVFTITAHNPPDQHDFDQAERLAAAHGVDRIVIITRQPLPHNAKSAVNARISYSHRIQSNNVTVADPPHWLNAMLQLGVGINTTAVSIHSLDAETLETRPT